LSNPTGESFFSGAGDRQALGVEWDRPQHCSIRLSADSPDLSVITDGGSKRYFYCQDANWNVIALRQGSNIVERYEYDPYGNVRIFKGYDSAAGHEDLTVVSDSTVRDVTDPPLACGNPILFAGDFYDNETGLYHVRHRMYSPTLARWLQRDPLGYVDGMNLHGYARTNPVRFRDPSGMGLLDWFWDWWCPKQCMPGCVKDVRFDYGLRWAWAKCDPSTVECAASLVNTVTIIGGFSSLGNVVCGATQSIYKALLAALDGAIGSLTTDALTQIIQNQIEDSGFGGTLAKKYGVSIWIKIRYKKCVIEPCCWSRKNTSGVISPSGTNAAYMGLEEAQVRVLT